MKEIKYFQHEYELVEPLVAKLPETKEVVKDIIWKAERCGLVPILIKIEPDLRKKIEQFIDQYQN